MTPAAELHAAAALLRKRAETADTGPWDNPLQFEVTRDYRRQGQAHIARWIASTATLDDYGDDSDDEIELRDTANATYIATVHPGVGLLLADWLEKAAADEDRYGAEPGTERALAVARAILGTDQRHSAQPGTDPSLEADR